MISDFSKVCKTPIKMVFDGKKPWVFVIGGLQLTYDYGKHEAGFIFDRPNRCIARQVRKWVVHTVSRRDN